MSSAWCTLGQSGGRGEFSIGVPNLRFTIIWSWGLRESQRGCHHHLFDSPPETIYAHILEGLREFTDIIGQLPRGVDVLPAQSILLEGRNQQGFL